MTYDTPMAIRYQPPLDEWLKDFYPGSPNYAVSLSMPIMTRRSVFAFLGLLLKRVGFYDDVEVLVKVGIFYVLDEGTHVFERKRVNWKII